jgi:hypothetical protein
MSWLTVWLSGNGVTGEIPSQLSRHFWQNAHYSRAGETLSEGDGIGRILCKEKAQKLFVIGYLVSIEIVVGCL